MHIDDLKRTMIFLKNVLLIHFFKRLVFLEKSLNIKNKKVFQQYAESFKTCTYVLKKSLTFIYFLSKK